jgi:hypothetical protein
MHAPTFLAVALLFAAVGFLASYLPAAHTTSIDLRSALRRE